MNVLSRMESVTNRKRSNGKRTFCGVYRNARKFSKNGNIAKTENVKEVQTVNCTTLLS